MKANRTLLIIGVAASIAMTAVALTASKAMAQPTRAPSAQLQQPTVEWDDTNQQWIFRVNGQLRGAYGAKAKLVIYVYTLVEEGTQNYTGVAAATVGGKYSDAEGNLLASTDFSVAFDPYELGVLSLLIPYSEANLEPGIFNMRAHAVLFFNGRSLGSSPWVYFNVERG